MSRPLITGVWTGLWRASVVAGIALLAALVPAAPAEAGTDFNGDGRADLAISASAQSLGGQLGSHEGLIHLLYGEKRKLRLKGNRVIHQDSPGIRERAEPGDVLGLGSGGDFNGDGRDDLVLSAPFEDLEAVQGTRHGAVGVVYGTRNGVGRRDQLFTQDTPGLRDRAESGDGFGRATEAGDFNGDGRDDLAIFSGEAFGSGPSELLAVGVVHVIYGGRKRLRAKRSQYFSQNKRGMKGPGAGELHNFGRVMAAGDFDGDGRDDLALAAPGEPVEGALNSGAVQVLYGTKKGLRTRRDQRLTESGLSARDGGPENSDGFGRGLASGDFDGDGYADLAIGVPLENKEDLDAFGAVHIVYGSSRRLQASGSDYITPREIGPEGMEPSIKLGVPLAAGDLDRNGRDDLAVGANPDETRLGDSGRVHVLLGRRGGLNLAGDQLLSQATPGLEGDGERPGDGFGVALAIANLNGRGPEELVIGEPQNRNDSEDGSSCREGGVHILYPNKRGDLTKRGTQFIEQATPGLRGGGREPCDLFAEQIAGR